MSMKRELMRANRDKSYFKFTAAKVVEINARNKVPRGGIRL